MVHRCCMFPFALAELFKIKFPAQWVVSLAVVIYYVVTCLLLVVAARLTNCVLHVLYSIRLITMQ